MHNQLGCVVIVIRMKKKKR